MKGNEMLEADKQELFRLVRMHIAAKGQSLTEMRIYMAHNGNPDGTLVTSKNMHLFRQFRNTVSGSPTVLVHAALADAPARMSVDEFVSGVVDAWVDSGWSREEIER